MRRCWPPMRLIVASGCDRSARGRRAPGPSAGALLIAGAGVAGFRRLRPSGRAAESEEDEGGSGVPTGDVKLDPPTASSSHSSCRTTQLGPATATSTRVSTRPSVADCTPAPCAADRASTVARLRIRVAPERRTAAPRSAQAGARTCRSTWQPPTNRVPTAPGGSRPHGRGRRWAAGRVRRGRRAVLLRRL